jgi:hypothetical protein
MNKTLIAVLVVVGVLIALVVGFLTLSATKKTDKSMADNLDGATPAATDDGSTQSASLRSLLGADSSQVCTYEDVTTSTEGTIYIGSGRMRGDISTVASGETINSHMISDGKFIYIWTDESEDGVKMSLANATQYEGQQNSGQTVDLDQKIDYTCSNWNVDNTKFTLPSINFQDFSAFLDNIDSSAPSQNSTNQCQVCDSLEGEEAATCKSALGC